MTNETRDTPHTVSELIDAFGGPTAFARVIGKEPSAASEMKRQGSVRVRYWPMIIAAARKREGLGWVTSDALMRMHADAVGPQNARAPA